MTNMQLDRESVEDYRNFFVENMPGVHNIPSVKELSEMPESFFLKFSLYLKRTSGREIEKMDMTDFYYITECWIASLRLSRTSNIGTIIFNIEEQDRRHSA